MNFREEWELNLEEKFNFFLLKQEARKKLKKKNQEMKSANKLISRLSNDGD